MLSDNFVNALLLVKMVGGSDFIKAFLILVYFPACN